MKIIVTRPAPDAAPFAAMLREAGVEPVLSPVMEIVRKPGPAPTGYDAVAFTSANGARAFAEASDDRAVPVFAVGAATADEARALGFADVRVADGDVEALARLIGSVAPKRTLHVAGADRAGDLVALLAAQGLSAERVTFYEARPIPGMTDAARAAFVEGAGVALFSPRSAVLFKAQAAAAGFTPPFLATAWCLSEAVADAAADFSQRRVAPAATAQSLVALIGEHVRDSAEHASPAKEDRAGHTPLADNAAEAGAPTSAPSPQSRRMLAPLGAAAVGVIAIAIALAWLSGRRPAPASPPPPSVETRLAPRDVTPATSAETPMGKVLNDTLSGSKTGIETIDRESFPAAKINE